MTPLTILTQSTPVSPTPPLPHGDVQAVHPAAAQLIRAEKDADVTQGRAQALGTLSGQVRALAGRLHLHNLRDVWREVNNLMTIQ